MVKSASSVALINAISESILVEIDGAILLWKAFKYIVVFSVIVKTVMSEYVSQVLLFP